MTTTDVASIFPERIPSGIPGLDVILGGGFFRRDTYVIDGVPGTGKTVFGNQLCFHHVAAGGRALYMTLFAETHAHMFSHLQSLPFFNHQVVGDALTYISGYRILESDGFKGLMQQLRHLIIERHITMLVIDGIVTAAQLAESDLEFRRFVHDVQAHAEATGCTVFLLRQWEPGSHYPEDSIADGLVRLSLRTLDNLRAVREIEVSKLRGSAFLAGRHTLELGSQGASVHPRTEALITQPAAPPPAATPRQAFGIARLDAMLNGGVPTYSTTLALGATGSGKTVLGLHYLAAGARQDWRGLYFGFSETPDAIMALGDQVRLGLSTLAQAGALDILWQSPLTSDLDAIAERLLAAVRRRQVGRLFLDGLDGLLQATAYPERLTRFFTSLVYGLRSEGVTTYVSLHMPDVFGPAVRLPIVGIEGSIDNLLFLRHVELRSQVYRLLSVLKMRHSGYDRAIREFAITSQGVELAATFDSAEAILTGIARTPRIVPPERPPGSVPEGDRST